MQQKPTQESLFWGVILITVGILFLLNNSGTITIRDLVSTYWPVLVILCGFLIILKNRQVLQQDKDPSGQSVRSETGALIHSNTFGDIYLNLKNHNFQSNQVRTVFGNIHIDATQLVVPAGEKTLNIDTVFGDIKFSVPKDTAVRVLANNLAGTIRIMEQKWDGLNHHVTFETANYARAKNKLILVCRTTFGDIKVW